MKRTTFLKSPSTFKTIFVLICLTYFTNAAVSQQDCLPNLTGFEFCVDAGPTICEPSSMAIEHIPANDFPFIVGPLLSENVATYHVVEAGRTSLIVVDIPAVGNLPGYNPDLKYYYGTPWINQVDQGDQWNTGTVQQVANPPSGMIRFEIPVTFARGAEKAFLSFDVQDLLGTNSGTTGRVTVPLTVKGPIGGQVDSLGTIIEPQLPYMILHAPPGDGSSAEFLEAKTTCRALQTNATASNSQSANLAVKLGVKGSIGFINTIDYEFSVTLKGGVSTGDMIMTSTDEKTCLTINNSFMTSELIDNAGGGDIFIGYGTDLAYGIYDYINIDEANCTAFVDRGLIYAPTGNPRQFIYNKATIQSEIENNKELMDDTTKSVLERNNAENQMDVWEQVLDLNLANINDIDNPETGSVSFSGGNTTTNSSTVSIAKTNSINYESYIEGTVGLETVLNIGGSGVSGGFEYKSTKKYGGSESQSEDEAITIKYTLSDDEGGNNPDVFNMKIYQDPMFGTPIFKVGDGSKTSCPYQGGYQRDQPVLQHDGVNEDHILLEGIPASNSATFKLDLCNDSDEARTYNLKLNAQSNLNGAVVSAAGVPLNGNDLGQSFELPAGSCIEDLVVEVRMQSETSPLSYPDLELFLYSPCEEGIQTSVFATVNFENVTTVEDVNTTVSALSCYPNPINDILYVDFELKRNEDIQLHITDMMGSVSIMKKLGKLNIGNHTYKLETTSLSKGMHMVSLYSNEGVTSKRILVY